MKRLSKLLFFGSFIFISGCIDSSPTPRMTPAEQGDQQITPTFITSDQNGLNQDHLFDPPDLDLVFDPCDPNPCLSQQRCESRLNSTTGQQEAECIDQSCMELQCTPDERCEEGPNGAQCVSALCTEDEMCLGDEYCDEDGQCVSDLCIPSTRRCDENTVLECDQRGANEVPIYECQMYQSSCVSRGQSEVGCACQADWECPSFLRCELGICVGQDQEPQCILEPVDFSESLPTPEIVWGDQSPTPPPFSHSYQVVMTPLVASLTDDNGDGLIDEADSPEMIFMSFCQSSFQRNGTLRAIHGGGNKRGQDLFASTGEEHWYEGDPMIEDRPCDQGILDPTAGLAVGDLDDPETSNRLVEIVALHEAEGIVIYSHRGEIILNESIRPQGWGPNPTIALANLDQQGMAEIIIGQQVITLERDDLGQLRIKDLFVGPHTVGRNGQGAISCVAPLLGDSRLEIIAGPTVYQLPSPPLGAEYQSDCTTQGGRILPSTAQEEAWCNGELWTVWQAGEVNRSPFRDGFCAVSDLWGEDITRPPSLESPLDGQPEVVLVAQGRMWIFKGETGELITSFPRLGLGEGGGAPNIGDFDGDGFPEIGSAFGNGYAMVDLQEASSSCPLWEDPINDEEEQNNDLNPSRPNRQLDQVCQGNDDCPEGTFCLNQQCRCLHNGWKKTTEDNSSRVTGSTLFDFNGDGRVEVIYNDECFFRIYDGTTGQTLFKEASESRTRIEHPIVADVDHDGNAEIAFGVSNESGFCSLRNQQNEQGIAYQDLYNAGLEVWGDPQDRWVSARRIWNQHSYHITNITESGQIPLQESQNWLIQGRQNYNSYRTQPSSYGIAPDLLIQDAQASITSSCASTSTSESVIQISGTLKNQGDLRVGTGITVGFYGVWNSSTSLHPLADSMGNPLKSFTPYPLTPQGGWVFYQEYSPQLDPTLSDELRNQLPSQVVIKADDDSQNLFGLERECNEDNNQVEVEITEYQRGFADLVLISIEGETTQCPQFSISARIKNLGSVPVSEYTLSLYTGDPQRGAPRFDQFTINTALEPNQEVTIELESNTFPRDRSIQPFAVLDANNLIRECDETNNGQLFPLRDQCGQTDGY